MPMHRAPNALRTTRATQAKQQRFEFGTTQKQCIRITEATRFRSCIALHRHTFRSNRNA
ncbi:hypothetical protein K788_0006853 [Paraburkholderia caribensis MBA4]|uniref:Uncharacterized protein n=1 Tax=Paraburkholderia caribensis MBA4 TaxID=1323664 RepID=A0A0P0R734_9BURK|nr:hypothetical protein K788_0006853 [Paraburkholderia caribensis MBA4]